LPVEFEAVVHWGGMISLMKRRELGVGKAFISLKRLANIKEMINLHSEGYKICIQDRKT
jgi:hypothetical protein